MINQERLDFFGVEKKIVRLRWIVRIGKSECDAVVGPDHIHVGSVATSETMTEGHAPRRMNPGSEGREEHYTPIADLVPEAFHNDGLIGGQDSRGVFLLLDVCDQIARSKLIEAVLIAEDRLGCLLIAARHLSDEPSDGATGLELSTEHVTMPEGHFRRGVAWRRNHLDPVMGYPGDPPCARAEQEGIALSRLIDHLLIEFADPAPVGQDHSVETTIRNSSWVGHRQLSRPGSSCHLSGGAIPGDAGSQLGEEIRRVPARQHVEGLVEDLTAQFGVGRCSPCHLVQIVG